MINFRNENDLVTSSVFCVTIWFAAFLKLRRGLGTDFVFLSFFDVPSDFSDFGLFPMTALELSDSVSDSAWFSLAGGPLNPKKQKFHITKSIIHGALWYVLQWPCCFSVWNFLCLKLSTLLRVVARASKPITHRKITL